MTDKWWPTYEFPLLGFLIFPRWSRTGRACRRRGGGRWWAMKTRRRRPSMTLTSSLSPSPSPWLDHLQYQHHCHHHCHHLHNCPGWWQAFSFQICFLSFSVPELAFVFIAGLYCTVFVYYLDAGMGFVFIKGLCFIVFVFVFVYTYRIFCTLYLLQTLISSTLFFSLYISTTNFSIHQCFFPCQGQNERPGPVMVVQQLDLHQYINVVKFNTVTQIYYAHNWKICAQGETK